MLTVDDGGADVNGAAYVLLSFGETGAGATEFRSTTASTCTAGQLDTENCDGDGVFSDQFFNNGEVAASYFDDFVIWQRKRRED